MKTNVSDARAFSIRLLPAQLAVSALFTLRGSSAVVFRCGFLSVAAFLFLCCTATAQTDPRVVVASAGGVDVVFTPDAQCLFGGRLIGGTISVSAPEGATIVGIENLLFERLHHVGDPVGQTHRWPITSAQGHSLAERRWYDSYVLLDEILDRDGNVFVPDVSNSDSVRNGFYETGHYNSAAYDPTGAESQFMDPTQSLTYRGDLYHSDSFSLTLQDRGNTVDIAHVVGIRGERSSFRLDVFGEGIESCVGDSGACFQFDLGWGTVMANHPPAVSFSTIEIPNAVEAGELLRFSAVASDADGPVELVEFLANETPISHCSFRRAPYECNWAPPPGDYTYTVRATDSLGQTSDAEPGQLTVLPAIARVRDGVLLSRAGVDVVFTLDPEPLLNDALIGGTFSLHSVDGAPMVTFANLNFENLHHVGVETPFGIFPTPVVTDVPGLEHARYDSHVLITDEMVGGSAGGHEFQEVGFDNDSDRDPANVQGQIPPDEFGNPAVAYRGDIFDEGAFFVLPEVQSASLDIAHLVGVPGDSTQIRLDVYGGSDFPSCGEQETGHHAISPFAVPELENLIGACMDFEIIWELGPPETLPADFDADGHVDGNDADALVSAIVNGSDDGRFDLSGDGIVSGEDLLQWLADAATENGFAAPYSLGDANLDGKVGAPDLNALGQNWLGDPNAWQLGDFNADGTVDKIDLEELAKNWLASIPPAGEPATAVPEPISPSVGLIVLALLASSRRRRQS